MILSYYIPASLLLHAVLAQADFNWSSIEPAPTLEYHDCYEVFKCARLQVPLDWSHPDDLDNPVAIAILTLPATVSETDPTFGGTIMYNPGGPGEAITKDPYTFLPYFQDLIDSEDRHYEWLSFDPRGTFHTTPRADCYKDEALRFADFREGRGKGSPELSTNGVSQAIAYAKGYSELCETRSANILPFMSTASVARDMVEIVDQVHELRRNTTGEQRSKDDPPRIQYYGPSYGTALGQYFASMFPERIGRIILDGVLNIDDWKEAKRNTWFTDTEASLNDFYQACFASEACALKRPTDSNWTDIKYRVDELLDKLDNTPNPIVCNGQHTILTSEDVRNQILLALYLPQLTFDGLASQLNDSINGNYTSQLPLRRLLSGSTFCGPPEEKGDQYTWISDARTSIACLDADESARNRSIEEYSAIWHHMYEQTPSLNVLFDLVVACEGRHTRPTYDFDGPFTIPPPRKNVTRGYPAAPILFLSTRHDPVTPLSNANTMSTRYPGSAVVSQNCTGHAIIFNQPSECSRSIIQEYFRTGAMPANGTTCEAQCHPWQDCRPLSKLDVGAPSPDS